MAVVAVVVFLAAYILIATERVPKMVTALAGAGIILAFGVASSEDAFYSHDTGIDWDVIFLLLGMMIIVGILRQTGVFEYVAIWAAKRAKGSPFRVMVLLVLITAVASAMLDNVTTVLLIAPVTLLVCERLGVSPIPFLIAEVLSSNIGGAATLIGDPPNIIIASRSGLTFNDFLLHMTPIAALAIAVLVAMLPLLFRGSFEGDPDRVADVMGLNEREAIKDRRLLIICGVVLTAVFIGFIGHAALHIEPSVVALLGAGILVLLSRSKPRRLHAQRGMGNAAVLRRPVRHDRRAGQDRGHRPDSGGGRARHRRRPTHRHDADLVRLGLAQRRCGQHPLHRSHEPDRAPTDPGHRRSGAG